MSPSSISTSTSSSTRGATSTWAKLVWRRHEELRWQDPDQPVNAALGGGRARRRSHHRPRRHATWAQAYLPRRRLLHLDLEAAPLGPAPGTCGPASPAQSSKCVPPVPALTVTTASPRRSDRRRAVATSSSARRLLNQLDLPGQLCGHLLVLAADSAQLAEVVDVAAQRPESVQPARCARACSAEISAAFASSSQNCGLPGSTARRSISPLRAFR